jgi:4-nitrophenyl phosphatase
MDPVQEFTVGDLKEKYDYFLVDCDGVLWSGTETIEGAVEAVKRLMDAGKKVFFVTNSSAWSVDGYHKKF